MPLKLSLKPKEAVVVNGAVLRNGERRGTILLQNQARVLRQKDVLEPEAAESPVEHLYFAIMQMYLTGETEGPLYDQAVTAIAAAMGTRAASPKRPSMARPSPRVCCRWSRRSCADCGSPGSCRRRRT